MADKSDNQIDQGAIMRLVLELYDKRYIVETTNPDQNDFSADELKELYSKLLVAAGFLPSVIETDGCGRWEYVGDDEIVVRREEAN